MLRKCSDDTISGEKSKISGLLSYALAKLIFLFDYRIFPRLRSLRILQYLYLRVCRAVTGLSYCAGLDINRLLILRNHSCCRPLVCLRCNFWSHAIHQEHEEPEKKKPYIVKEIDLMIKIYCTRTSYRIYTLRPLPDCDFPWQDLIEA